MCAESQVGIDNMEKQSAGRQIEQQRYGLRTWDEGRGDNTFLVGLENPRSSQKARWVRHPVVLC